MARLRSLAACIAAAAVSRLGAADPQPNPPVWSKGVYVWGPDSNADEIQNVANEAFRKNGGHTPEDHGQFSPFRYAFLFKPGTYHVDIPVGFYTQVLGLGDGPGDVVFDAARGPYSEEGDQEHMGGALSSFWRGAENFETRSDMLWAVSQAAPMRRVIVDKDLTLAEYIDGVGMGYASGGFLGNVEVGGKLYPGSQQQFCVRNGNFVGGWSGGVWNMVFIGAQNAPEGHCGNDGGMAYVTVDRTPVIAEKPFVTIDEAGKFFLNVPETRADSVGTDFTPGKKIPFEEVYVAQEGDTAAVINEHLKQGLHLILPAAIWELDEPLQVNTAGQVVLGLGLATLKSTNGNSLIEVGNVDGVRIAGVLLEAGETLSDTLLKWGEDSTFKGNLADPGYAFDIFARVGGPWDPADKQQRSRLMVQFNAGNVIGDNFWLWRGDHWGKPGGAYGLVRNGDNRCDTGLEVNGDDVTIYGLAVEHTLKDLVQWGGQGGRTYFFQSELPYDVNQDWGDAGYVGYRVMDNVLTHQAYGVGVYHFFRDYAVTVESGIACPAWLENSFESPLTVHLSGKGRVLHVLNQRGEMSDEGEMVQWFCEKGPVVEVPANPPTTTRPSKTKSPLVVKRKSTKEPSSEDGGAGIPKVLDAPTDVPNNVVQPSAPEDSGVVIEAIPPASPVQGAPVEDSVAPPDVDTAPAALAPLVARPQENGLVAEPIVEDGPSDSVQGSIVRPAVEDSPLNAHQGGSQVPWWAWVIVLQTFGMGFLCGYVFLLHRRCFGKPIGADGVRTGGSPFMFQGLPSWSPGGVNAAARRSGVSPNTQTGGSPHASAGWGTPEEKVRRTNSSRASGGRDSRAVVQRAVAEDDKADKRPEGVLGAIVKFGFNLHSSTSAPASPATRSCQSPGAVQPTIPEEA